MRVSIVSGPAKRRLASRPVSASGEKDGAFLQDQPHFVVPVDVVVGEGDETRAFRGFGVQCFADQCGGGRSSCPVRRRNGWRGGTGRCPSGRRRNSAPTDAVSAGRGCRRRPANMTERSAANTSLGERAGEATSGFDQRDQAAGHHVDALEDAFQQQADFAHQPVGLVLLQQAVGGEHLRRIAFGYGRRAGRWSGSFSRRCNSASSSSRAIASGQNAAPASWMPRRSPGRSAGPGRVMVARRGLRGRVRPGHADRSIASSVDRAVQGRQGDAFGAVAVGSCRQFQGAFGDLCLPGRGRNDLVDQAPFDGALAADAFLGWCRTCRRDRGGPGACRSGG